MDAAIAAAVAAIDLSPYYTSAQTDAAITAALIPVTLANAPAWGANPPTWELLKGTNVLRNLHFAGPLTASLQNNTDTLEIDCDPYAKAETFSQAETNAAISAALGALNLGQYQTSAQVDTAISDALVPYYTAAEVDAAIAGQSVDLSDYYTRTQSDSRYFPNNANPGNAEVFTLVRDSVSIPRQIRGILPRAPLAWSYLFSGAITELRCDAYSKAEADGRYLSSTGYTTAALPGDKCQRRLQRGLHRHQGPQRRAQAAEGHPPKNAPGLEPHPQRNGHGAHLRRLQQDGGGRALRHCWGHFGCGRQGHGPGELRRGARRHLLRQPHGQQRREHPELHRHGQHHGSGRALHPGRADAPAEAHQRGGRPPAHRSRPREHQDG